MSLMKKCIKKLLVTFSIICFILTSYLILVFSCNIEVGPLKSLSSTKVNMPLIIGYNIQNLSPINIKIIDVNVEYNGPGPLIISEPFKVTEPSTSGIGMGTVGILQNINKISDVKGTEIKPNSIANLGISYIGLAKGSYTIKQITVKYSVAGIVNKKV